MKSASRSILAVPVLPPAHRAFLAPRAPFSSRRFKTGRLPYVLMNMAMTTDGKIATSNRAISSFGSRRDHEHLLALRATADAVMAGARTVDLNPVNLGPGSQKYRRLRVKRGLAANNLRIIVSRSGSVHPQAEIFRQRFSPILVLTTRRASHLRLARLRALADAVAVCGTREIDFPGALRWLRREWGVRRLICEGGGELNDTLFRADMVDELHLTICPRIAGGRAAPTIAEGLGAASLLDCAKLKPVSFRRQGDELYLVYHVLKSGGA